MRCDGKKVECVFFFFDFWASELTKLLSSIFSLLHPNSLRERVAFEKQRKYFSIKETYFSKSFMLFNQDNVAKVSIIDTHTKDDMYVR